METKDVIFFQIVTLLLPISLHIRRECVPGLPAVSVQHGVFSSDRDRLQPADHGHLCAHLAGSTSGWDATHTHTHTHTHTQSPRSDSVLQHSRLSQVCCWTLTWSWRWTTWPDCCWRRRTTKSGQISSRIRPLILCFYSSVYPFLKAHSRLHLKGTVSPYRHRGPVGHVAPPRSPVLWSGGVTSPLDPSHFSLILCTFCFAVEPIGDFSFFMYYRLSADTS